MDRFNPVEVVVFSAKGLWSLDLYFFRLSKCQESLVIRSKILKFNKIKKIFIIFSIFFNTNQHEFFKIIKNMIDGLITKDKEINSFFFKIQ